MTQLSHPTPKVASSHENNAGAKSGQSPVVIDLGKKRRKSVQRLRKGKPGKLMDKVVETIEHLRGEGVVSAGAQVVVVVIRERRSSRGLLR